MKDILKLTHIIYNNCTSLISRAIYISVEEDTLKYRKVAVKYK